LSITAAFSDPVDHRAALFVYGDKARNSNFPARESEHVTLSPEVLNLLERRMAGKPAGPDSRRAFLPVDEVKKLYADGLSIRQIAKHFGCVWGTVERALKRED
jgi:DNA-directed RNA polymerase specialized sigma24 family protein